MAFGALVSGGLQIAGTAIAHEMESEEAEKVRRWQKDMSDTALSRRIKDMKRAGINPILAVGPGVGASTPPGAMARAAKPDIASGISGGTAYAQFKENKKTQKTQRDLMDKQGDKADAETMNNRAQQDVREHESAYYRHKLKIGKEEWIAQRLHNMHSAAGIPGAKLDMKMDQMPAAETARWVKRYSPMIGKLPGFKNR